MEGIPPRPRAEERGRGWPVTNNEGELLTADFGFWVLGLGFGCWAASGLAGYLLRDLDLA